MQPAFRLADLDPTWVQQLEQVDVRASRRSAPGVSEESLSWLGLEGDDGDVVLRTFPDASSEPDRWWLLTRMHAVLTDGIPGADPPVELRMFDHLGTAGTLFPLHALVAAVPDVVRFHRTRGIPSEVTRATLHVGDALEHDDRGLPVLDTSGWFLWRYRGLLYQVGCLRVIPVRLGEAPDSESYYEGADVHPRAPGHRRGDPAMSIHIPAGTPFTPLEVRESLDAIAPAFSAWFHPEPAPRIGTCGSWLLDPQLRRYLPPDSNITRFQEHFTLFDEGRESTSIMPFVFPDGPDLPIDQLPTRTTLQRAVVAHLRAGFRWRSCGGWTPLTAS